MERCSPLHKLRLFILFMLAYLVFYIFPNVHAKGHPAYLPLLPIDQATPFLPWTFFVYTSDYFLILFTILLIDEESRFRAFSRMAFLVLMICGSFFIFFPTTYPRPPYPLVSFAPLAFVMHWIQKLDTPNNCFPSMHVALTGICTWALRHKGAKIYLPFGLWTLAIFVSTMTTKQHYFMDVVSGSCVICFVALIEHLVFERNPGRGLNFGRFRL